MQITLTNPLPVAIIGNPPKGSRMGRKLTRGQRRHLAQVWRAKTASGSLSYTKGYRARVRHVAGRKVRNSAIPGSGRSGTVEVLKLIATNPQKAAMNLVGAAKANLITPITSLPRSLPALVRGSPAKNLAFAAGGGLTGLVGGGFVGGFAFPLIAKIPGAGVVLSTGIGQRVVGAALSLLIGGLVGRTAIKDQGSRTAWQTGVAAAALVEAIFPGRAAGYLAQLPVIGPMLAPMASPVQGLAGLYGLGAYVEAPAYQGDGIGAYVSAPGYQGVGAYVSAPGYQGVGGADDAVAGGHLGESMGSNMRSHLD